jgi:peptide/nickel transport system substrate-binding protein
MFKFSFNRLTSGITVALGLAVAATPALASVQGGTLIYLEQQAHTNLYPPSRRLLPQRRHPQPDHRQADLPEPKNAGD